MSNQTFADLGLADSICRALEALSFTQPTPIQARAIPTLLSGLDVMASAQTGTGKTAAFMLPALQILQKPAAVFGHGPRVLVLTPTRELAQQVCKAAQQYGKQLRAKVVSIVGGESYQIQNRAMSQPFDILVATPGRLIDHLQRGKLDMSRLELFVLDEADRMLDMGFVDDVRYIGTSLPSTRQTALFSATLDGVIGDLAAELLNKPEKIEISTSKTQHTQITQVLHYVDDMAHKQRLLQHLLDDPEVQQSIVFTATKRDADDLADWLSMQGQNTAALHGDMQQRQRERTIEKLRRGQVRVLVATDVAARGIDVAGITHVFNFDLPRVAEDYVHRIGRTGRAGATGTAISFGSSRDMMALKRIERMLGKALVPSVVAGLEPRFKPRPSAGANDRGGRSGGFGGGNGRGDRAPRGNSFADRAPRSEGFADRAPRSADFTHRPARSEGFADRAPRNEGFSDRAPRGNSFADRAPRSEGFADRAPRSEGFADRAPRGNSFADRAPRSEGFADRRAPEGNRAPRPAAAWQDSKPADRAPRAERSDWNNAAPARRFGQDDAMPKRAASTDWQDSRPARATPAHSPSGFQNKPVGARRPASADFARPSGVKRTPKAG